MVYPVAVVVMVCGSVSTTPENLLQFEITPGNPGNLPEFYRYSWKI